MKERDSIANNARPSGDLTTLPGYYEYRFDLGTLRTMTECCNPYNIDLVVAELGGEAYNVFLYFRDAGELVGSALRSRVVTVIQLRSGDRILNYRAHN